MPKDRGIEKVESYFGDFLKLVEQRVRKQKKGKVRILDAGCGYGVAMMGFVKRFGNKVEIVGFNSVKRNGNVRIMKQQAVKKGIFTKEELKKIRLPEIVYCDASKRLPFKDDSFDFIYSMASIYLYDDKIHFLEECNRILKKQGVARISPSFGIHNDQSYGKVKNIPEEYWEFWRIWNKGKEIKVWDYCKSIKGVKAVWRNRNKKGGSKPCYIEIRKQKKLDFGLRFIASIDMNLIWHRWGGVKSIYTTQKKGTFVPRYRK